MKLKLTDQIAVTAVRNDTLRPGEEIEVSDTLGRELLTQHRHAFLQIGAAVQIDQGEAETAKPAKRRKTKAATTGE